MRIKHPLAALCGVTLLIGSAAAQSTHPADITASATPVAAVPNTDKNADAGRPAGEVEDLRRRVEDLEGQNRAMAQALAEINAKLGASSGAGKGPGAARRDGSTLVGGRARAAPRAFRPSTSGRRPDPHAPAPIRT